MAEQLTLRNTVEISKEVDGIEMGVLADGTAYLTGRGVARLCGVAPSTIINQKDEWSAGKRVNKFAKLLQEKGYFEKELFIPVKHDGRDAHAYPEPVCMAFLEYFAFESPSTSRVAVDNFRRLASAGLTLFVYTALGYARPAIAASWQKFHDRMLLVTAPIGYFSVFKEIADFAVAAIQGGLSADEHTIPDISVGKIWAKLWTDGKLEETFGERVRFEHHYPESYPQAISNPQEIWVYPIRALGEFRAWMQRTYIPQRLPKYLAGKVRDGVLPESTARILIAQATPPALPRKTGT